MGIRVNPGLSFAEDARYDPARPDSKLGAPLLDVAEALKGSQEIFEHVEGVHFHSNCESDDFGQLLRTVQELEQHIGDLLRQVKWINLGGGYLFENVMHVDALKTAIRVLENTYGLQVFIEPGTALVQSAGSIISSVIDIFSNGQTKIAIMDTTINHMPEVFEYGYEPDVAGHGPDNEFEYLLAGSSCLAGDIFGTYRFAEPLDIGSRVTFENMGAYSMVKAHTFNGINLPSIYTLDADGELNLVREFTYEDYASRWSTQNIAID